MTFKKLWKETLAVSVNSCKFVKGELKIKVFVSVVKIVN